MRGVGNCEIGGRRLDLFLFVVWQILESRRARTEWKMPVLWDKARRKQAVKMMTVEERERLEARTARHRALIMQILHASPDGLTVQEIIAQELEFFGFSFLTDNRLRELRALGWVESTNDFPAKWKIRMVSMDMIGVK
jgi:hypothetical protein